MEAFILGLLYALPSWARPIVRPLTDRLLGVWRWSDSLARRIKYGFAWIVTGAAAVRDGMWRLGSETFDTLRWLVLTKIPGAVNVARTAIIAWAVARINEAKSLAARALAGLTRWTEARVRELFAGLDAARRWVAGLLAPLRESVRQLLARVFGVLSTPQRLVAWIVGTMWTALWRYAWDNLDRLADALWRQRQRLILRTIAETERIIGRLL